MKKCEYLINHIENDFCMSFDLLIFQHFICFVENLAERNKIFGTRSLEKIFFFSKNKKTFIYMHTSTKIDIFCDEKGTLLYY